MRETECIIVMCFQILITKKYKQRRRNTVSEFEGAFNNAVSEAVDIAYLYYTE